MMSKVWFPVFIDTEDSSIQEIAQLFVEACDRHDDIDDKIFALIKELDRAMEDYNFTERVRDYFVQEMEEERS